MTTTAKITVGTKIVAGRGEDREQGTVIAINGDNVTVAWEQAACQTTQPINALEDLEIL